MTTKHAALIARNSARWAAAQLTRGPEFAPVAKRLLAAKARYQAVSAKTNVPWFVIAVIHQRESAQSWHGSLAQGDPWNQVSTHVPKGRGPFNSWEEAAIDALVNCAPHASRWKDWSPGGTMTLLELYNGLGYFNKGLPSPYVWSGTDQYQRGKYVADGVFDPSVVDKQLGCAGLILALKALDPSIKFGGTQVPVPTKPAEPVTVRNVTIGGMIAAGAVAVLVFFRDHPVEIVIGAAACIGLYAFIRHQRKKP